MDAGTSQIIVGEKLLFLNTAHSLEMKRASFVEVKSVPFQDHHFFIPLALLHIYLIIVYRIYFCDYVSIALPFLPNPKGSNRHAGYPRGA